MFQKARLRSHGEPLYMCLCMHACAHVCRAWVCAHTSARGRTQGRKKTGKTEGGNTGGLGRSDYEMLCPVTDFQGKEQLGLPQWWHGDP